MHLSTFAALSFLILNTVALPQDNFRMSSAMPYLPQMPPRPPSPSLTTLSLTLTVTTTHTYTFSAASEIPSPPSYTSGLPVAMPSTALTMLALRSGSSIHLLGANAAGLRLYLGGDTATYCSAEVVKNCPPGNITAFAATCGMDVVVPGGQQIYISPDGSIGYTQAHSLSRPKGSNICPLTYSKQVGAQFGYWGLNPALAFGATGFMACPASGGSYQIFAALPNATVPHGDVSSCLEFVAAAPQYLGDVPAWQYT